MKKEFRISEPILLFYECFQICGCLLSNYLAYTDTVPIALRHFSQLMLLETKSIKCNIIENSVMERQATKVSEIRQVGAF